MQERIVSSEMVNRFHRHWILLTPGAVEVAVLSNYFQRETLSPVRYRGKTEGFCLVLDFTRHMVIRPDRRSPVHMISLQRMIALTTVRVSFLLKLENDNGQV